MQARPRPKRRGERRREGGGQAAAERGLQASLGKLIAVAEAYPQLKADKNFLDLQQQLADVEDQLQMARRYYNGTVRNLNIAIQSFPSNLLAGPLGFRAEPFFELDDRREAAAPGVAFAAPKRLRRAMIARMGQPVAKPVARAFRRPLTLLLAIALLIAVVVGGRALAAERILRFVSDVTVEREGDLAVTETIRVEAEGNEIRHGILRDFPTTYVRPDGSRVVVGFVVQSVRLDGMNVHWATERIANGVRVRIGSADTMVSHGEHAFVIRYRTTRQIGFFADRDELYWNATGTGWTFPIDQAEARITLPDAVPFTQAAFYTGPQGARGQDAAIVTREPGVIVFRTTKALPARSGLTVAAAWQKGLVTPPTTADQATSWLHDNLPVAAAGLGLVGVLAFYAFAWMRFGRDPPVGTIIPLFGPPDGMSAAAVRYVDRMGFDARCFTAAIVDLGVNRHLRMSGSRSETVLWHLDGGKPIKPAESAVETKLFAANPSIKLVQSNRITLVGAKAALKSGLDQAYDGTLFTDNYGWSWLGLALVTAVIAAVIFLSRTIYDADRGAAVTLAIVIPLAVVVIGAFIVRAGHRRQSAQRSGGGLLMVTGAVLIAAAAAGGIAMMTSLGGHVPLDLLPLAAAYILAPLGLLGFHWLQAPTVEGRAVMDRIEGFRQYLGVAEEDRLNALNPPDKTPELFERFLPYALALDVENRWAARFAAVLAAAAAAGAGAATMSWYQGNQSGQSGYDPLALTDALSGALTQTIASASTAPGSSSGSSGGGFSGGGGGGGGGSGW